MRCPKCLHTLILARDLNDGSMIWACYRCPYYESKSWLMSPSWSQATKRRNVSSGLTDLELLRWIKSEPSFDKAIATSLFDLEVERRRRAKLRYAGMLRCGFGIVDLSKLKEITEFELHKEEAKPLREIQIEKSLAKRIISKFGRYINSDRIKFVHI